MRQARRTLLGAHPQVLHMDVYRRHRHAQSFLECVSDHALNIAGDDRDTCAILNDHVEINYYVVTINMNFNPTPVTGRLQNLDNATSQILDRHAYHTVAFQHDLAGKTRKA